MSKYVSLVESYEGFIKYLNETYDTWYGEGLLAAMACKDIRQMFKDGLFERDLLDEIRNTPFNKYFVYMRR